MHARELVEHSDLRSTSRVYTHVDLEDLRGAVE